MNLQSEKEKRSSFKQATCTKQPRRTHTHIFSIIPPPSFHKSLLMQSLCTSSVSRDRMILVFSDQRRFYYREQGPEQSWQPHGTNGSQFLHYRASLATNKGLSSRDKTSSCSFEWICDMRSEGLPRAYLGQGRAGRGGLSVAGRHPWPFIILASRHFHVSRFLSGTDSSLPAQGAANVFPKANPSPLQALPFLPQNHSVLLQES